MIYPRCKPLVRNPVSSKEALRPPSPDNAPKTNKDTENGPKSPPSSNPHLNNHSRSHTGRSRSPNKNDIFLKSRVDQSVQLMKIIYERAGEPIRPGGHSQFDALGTLKSDMALKLLHKKRWADFFEEFNTKDMPASTAAEHYPDNMHSIGGAPSAFMSVDQPNASRMDSEETFHMMKKRVRQLWKELKIPSSDTDFYSYNILRTCSRSIEQFSDIARYIVVLSNYRSSTMAVLEEIHNREFAVAQLLDCLSQINRRSAINDYKPVLLNKMQQVQISSINVIHQIQNWRANFWRALPFHFRGENYLLKMQTDLDALKTESLGSILRDCSIRAADLLCILFVLDNLDLNESGDLYDESRIRLISAIPLHPLLDATATVVSEADLQHELKMERRRLVRDGMFIPMLRYEHSLEASQSTRISGGVIPVAMQLKPTMSMTSLYDDSSRTGNNMSQATDSSSRIDL